MTVVDLQTPVIKRLRTEIETLKNQLEYAYRCIEAGYETGVFDFRTLRQEARDYLLNLEPIERKTKS